MQGVRWGLRQRRGLLRGLEMLPARVRQRRGARVRGHRVQGLVLGPRLLLRPVRQRWLWRQRGVLVAANLRVNQSFSQWHSAVGQPTRRRRVHGAPQHGRHGHVGTVHIRPHQDPLQQYHVPGRATQRQVEHGCCAILIII